MRATMRQQMATAWGNEVAIELSTDLDNAHALTTSEIALLMTLTMSKFVEQVREHNALVIENGSPAEEMRVRVHGGGDRGGQSSSEREEARLAEMRGAT